MDEEIPRDAPPTESSFFKALTSPTCLGTGMMTLGRIGQVRILPLSIGLSTRLVNNKMGEALLSDV